MNLYIDGKEAVISESDSFTYFEESQFFSDSSGYSLDITLPLKDCARNRAIFGHIELNPPASAKWPAQIVCGAVTRTGTALLTDVGIAEVKVQFLAGKSTSAMSDVLENTYINRLSLPTNRIQNFSGVRPTSLMQDYDYQLTSAFKASFPDHTGAGIVNFVRIPGVVIPWWSIAESVTHNNVNAAATAYDSTVTRCGVSWMPYLLPLAKEICRACGYAPKFDEWEASTLRNLIVCNAVPMPRVASWEYDFAKALPHWKVAEFFNNISPLLNGVFEIDRLRRTVTFRDAAADLRSRGVVHIAQPDDEYQIQSSFGMEETDGKYVKAKPFRYADCGLDMWKYMDCPWYPLSLDSSRKTEFTTLSALLKYMKDHRESKAAHHRIYYAQDRAVWVCYYNYVAVEPTADNKYQVSSAMVPRLLNLFGPADYDAKDEPEYTELKVVPAMAVYDKVWLDPGEAPDGISGLINGYDPDEDDTYFDEVTEVVDSDADIEAILKGSYQPHPIDEIENGEVTDTECYYDNLFVGWWDGYDGGEYDKFAPATCGFRLGDYDIAHTEPFSMRLNDPTNPGSSPYAELPEIDESVKYVFSFYSPTLPDVNAEFLIKGKRYLCKRLEATFTSRGMSRRIKGEFYRIVRN